MTEIADGRTTPPTAFENAVHRLGGYRAEPWRAVFTSSSKQGYRHDEVIVNRAGELTGNTFLIEQFREREIDSIRKQGNALYSLAKPIVPIPPKAKLPPVSSHHSVLYAFCDKPDEVTFYVERAAVSGHDDNGKPKKRYVPWCYREGKGWDKSEPNISLPVYGQELLRERPTFPVMVHEGPKAADAAQKIARGEAPYDNHPWTRYFQKFIHVGWHGSNFGLNRTKWSELKGREVFVLSDMDVAGQELARRLCHILIERGAKKAHYSWWSEEMMKQNESWDVADDIPLDHISKMPLLVKDIKSAFKREFLVEQSKAVVIDGKERLVWEVREDFVKAFCYVARTDSFHLLSDPLTSYPDTIMDKNYAAQHPHIERLSRAMHAHPALIKVDRTTLAPKQGRVVREQSGARTEDALNMYSPPDVDAKSGSIRPLLKLMRRVVPGRKDRRVVMRWMAHLVCRPDIKMRWALLLISEHQGIGKTTLIEFLSYLVGAANTWEMSASKFITGKFNGFVSHTLLLNLSEMEEASDRKSYNAVKSRITDPTIEVELKNKEPFSQPNRMNIVASSNYKNPLALEESDRRWFITESGVKSSLPTLEAIALRRWFFDEGGAGAVLFMCRKWFAAWSKMIMSEDTDEKKLALGLLDVTKPPTSAKKIAMLSSSRPAWKLNLDELVDALEDNQTVYVPDLIARLDERKSGKISRTTTVADYLTHDKELHRVDMNGETRIKIAGLGMVELYSRTPRMSAATAINNLVTYSKTVQDGIERYKSGVAADVVSGNRSKAKA